MRYAHPQPYEELSHTADAGLVVEGSSPEEALARLVLGLGSLLAGGASFAPEREERFSLQGDGLVAIALAALRELLYRFATERLLPASCEVVRLEEAGAEMVVGVGAYDPERHAEGMDIKAITYHAARFERIGERWRAQVLFDI